MWYVLGIRWRSLYDVVFFLDNTIYANSVRPFAVGGMIEHATSEEHSVDFRKGDGRISRSRHYVYGGASKTAFILFLGQDDFKMFSGEVADQNVHKPQTEIELTIREVSTDQQFENDYILTFHGVTSGLPAPEVLTALGMEYNIPSCSCDGSCWATGRVRNCRSGSWSQDTQGISCHGESSWRQIRETICAVEWSN